MPTTRIGGGDRPRSKLLAFSCKTRGLRPGCHQREVKQTSHWIAQELCFNVPHRQFVFTMPRPLRGIFRKRRKLLTLLFREAIACLRDWFRVRLGLPEGELAAIAGVQTSGDYLVFHPHLHVLAATGLVDAEGQFHQMPVESLKPLEELFRHRFLAALHREKLISKKKAGEIEPPPAIWWECGGPARPEPHHPELELGDGRVLVLDGDPGPEDDLPVYGAPTNN